MSASNWAVCPRCQQEHDQAIEAQLEQARLAYGTVDSEEYERLRHAARQAAGTTVTETFREDYEIYGAEDGAIIVSYSGHCQKCSLGLDFKDERPFWPGAN